MNSELLTLPDSLKIDTVEALREALDARLADAGDVEIDASQCEAIDYCGLQLLMTFNKALADGDRSIRWSNVSEALSQAASDIGANALFAA